MTTHVFTTATILLACCGLAAFSSNDYSDPSAGCEVAPPRCKAAIGAGEFNVVHPIRLGLADDMKRQMIARLTYVEALLRDQDVSSLLPELRAERLRNLDRLHAYRLRAEFPANDAYPGELRPCFIDGDGNICAVGYLVEQSIGRPAAERLNARYQYATVNQMRSAELDTWIARSGFTHAEVATIQEPGFNRRPNVRMKERAVVINRLPQRLRTQSEQALVNLNGTATISTNISTADDASTDTDVNTAPVQSSDTAAPVAITPQPGIE